jgi:hypothetical protein
MVKRRNGMSATATSKLEIGRDRRELDPQRGFASHREFLFAVMHAGRGVVDERLLPLRASVSADTGTYDYELPEAWAPRVHTVSGIDPTADRTQLVRMEQHIVHCGARVDQDHSTSVSGGLQLIRIGDTPVEHTPKRVKMESVQLTANTLIGISFATEKVIQDSPRALIDLLERSYADEAAVVRREEFIHGTGINEPLGIMNSGCLLTITKEGGQAVDTVVAQNFLNMRARCWGYHDAVWIVHQELFPMVAQLVVVVGTGGSALPIWQPADDENGIPDRILGRPAYFMDAAKVPGDKGDVICANFREYLDGTYLPPQLVNSIHVRFTSLERAFRFSNRGDGQPWWRVPLTPKRATTGKTLSPFVTLEAR